MPRSLGNPPRGQAAEDGGEMADPARAQQLGDQDGAAGQRRGGTQQPARHLGRGVVEGPDKDDWRRGRRG